MKTSIFKLLFGGLIMSAVVLSGCSKSEAINDLKENPQLLKTNAGNDQLNTKADILNRDLVIIYAVDNGANITQEFKDFTFNFQGTPPSGQAHVWNDLLAQTGKWYMQENMFGMDFPTNIFRQLAFLNREWATGESDEMVIRLIAADGDEVHFSAK